MARLVVEHLVRHFPTASGGLVRAVDDLSLALDQNELFVLVGPSGCGKTTTLRLIAGLEEATSGAVRLDGRDLTEVPARERDVGFVFQHHALYPHLSVLENLAFGLRVRKLPRGEIQQRVGEAARILALEDVLGRFPSQLSGGQRQRVALGRALVRRPRLCLFDEPLSNLDGPMRAQLRAELVRLHARLGIPWIYVTHDQAEAMMLGHRIGVMRQGVLQQAASPLEIYQRPLNRFVAAFFGSPPMNFFAGELAAAGQALCFRAPGGFQLRVDPRMAPRLRAWAGKPLTLGLRPEHLSHGPGAANPAAEESLEAVVDLAQPLGNEVYLTLAVGPVTCTARVPAADAPACGTKVVVRFDLSQAHFFEPGTECRIETAV